MRLSFLRILFTASICLVSVFGITQSSSAQTVPNNPYNCFYTARKPVPVPELTREVPALQQNTADTIVPPSPPPPTNPAEIASQNGQPGFTFATTTLDSFKKEVSVKLSWDFNTHCPSPAFHDSRPRGFVLSPRNSLYLLNTSVAYDDQWKDGAPALSTVSQNYSALAINLSKLIYRFPTTLLASGYHNNQQGIVFEQEYGVGFNGKFSGGIIYDPDHLTPQFRLTLIASIGVREAVDQLEKTNTSATFGPGTYLQATYLITTKANLAGSFKGFAPTETPLVNGRASADVKYTYKIGCQWSTTAEVTDTYFATVPSGYRPNSLTTSIGLKFDPSAKIPAKGTLDCPK